MLNSPKEIAQAIYNASCSRTAKLYQQQDPSLYQELPHVITLHFDKVVHQYTGTFKLIDFKKYRQAFLAKPCAGVAVFRPLICTYVITCTASGQVYVGSSTEFFVRWSKHANLLKNGNHTNLRLQEVFDQHGEDAFTITILKCFGSTRTLLDHEVLAGKAYAPELILNYKLGNVCVGGWYPNASKGQGRATRPSKSSRRKNSVERWFDGSGVLNIKH